MECVLHVWISKMYMKWDKDLPLRKLHYFIKQQMKCRRLYGGFHAQICCPDFIACWCAHYIPSYLWVPNSHCFSVVASCHWKWFCMILSKCTLWLGVDILVCALLFFFWKVSLFLHFFTCLHPAAGFLATRTCKNLFFPLENRVKEMHNSSSMSCHLYRWFRREL